MEHIDVSTLAGMRMVCDCGRTHEVPIKKIITGKDALGRLPEMLSEFKGAKVVLVGDSNTMPLARKPVIEALNAAGCEVCEHTFTKDELLLDEWLIGSMLIHMPSQPGLIVAIGSGTMNDLCRVIGARCGVPYIIIGTAPSMDGYASVTSAVMVDGLKTSVPLSVPYGILTDIDLMLTAPDEMLSAGVGDILGKYVALNDWQLAARETGECFCPYIADMMSDAVGRCVAGIPQIATRDSEMIQALTDTLVMSGVAISMHGQSRPAAGSEHQLAHCWESAGHHIPGGARLHGNYVAFGTEIACRLYELAGEEYDLKFSYRMPAPHEIRDYMKALGGFSTIEALGITRELLWESFMHATSNKRFTLIAMLEAHGKLERYAKRIADEYFPG